MSGNEIGEISAAQLAAVSETHFLQLAKAAASKAMVLEREPEPIQFSDYTADLTHRRQVFWLSRVSRFLAEMGEQRKVLDIGSNIHWVTGIASSHDVTMLDVRDHPLKGCFPFEFVRGNATRLPFDAGTFDAVTFPQVLHWIGSATYGDEFNIDADTQTLREISRVLKPTGYGVFTTFVLPRETVVKVLGRRLFGVDYLEQIVRSSDLVFDRLELFDYRCKPIGRNEIPNRTGDILISGNPDEDLAWAFCVVRRRGDE